MSTNTGIFLFAGQLPCRCGPSWLEGLEWAEGTSVSPGTGQWGGIQEKRWHRLAERMPVGGAWTSTLCSAHVTHFWGWSEIPLSPGGGPAIAVGRQWRSSLQRCPVH